MIGRFRLRWIVASAAAAFLVVLILVSHTLGAAKRKDGVPLAQVDPGASTQATGTRTVEGAVAAAVQSVLAAERLVAMDEASAAEAQRAMAATASADALAERMRAQIRALDAAFGGRRPLYRVAVVGVAVTSASDTAASVSVWYVGIVVPPDEIAYQDWRRADIQLVWERGGWCVAAEDDMPAPRPALLARAASNGNDDVAPLLEQYSGVGR